MSGINDYTEAPALARALLAVRLHVMSGNADWRAVHERTLARLTEHPAIAGAVLVELADITLAAVTHAAAVTGMNLSAALVELFEIIDDADQERAHAE